MAEDRKRMVPILPKLLNRVLAKKRTKNGGKRNGYVDSKSEAEMTNITVDPDTCDPTAAWRRLKKGQNIQNIKPLDWTSPVPEDCVRCVCISDTHSRVELRRNFWVPDGDILLFAGDMTMSGTSDEIKTFDNFIGKLPHRHKIVIAGNHDYTLGEDNDSKLLTNCTYIEDEQVEISGIKIYGSPWVPVFGTNAFSLFRGQDLLDKWNKIPESTDILLTHVPPAGIGDMVPGNEHVGCVELLNTVQHRVKPKYHVFGHIHEGYGMYTDGTTCFVNASTCGQGYKPVHRPIVFDMKVPEGHDKSDILKRCDISNSTNNTSEDSKCSKSVCDPMKKEV